MVAEEVFVNCYSFNPMSQVKKAIFKVSFKTIRARSRNSDLRLRGAGVGAKRIYFGSTTLKKTVTRYCLRIAPVSLELSDLLRVRLPSSEF
jgi:hypothetical protein